jgi:hypothetical protein
MQAIRYSGGRFWIAFVGVSGIGLLAAGMVSVAAGRLVGLLPAGLALPCLHNIWVQCYRVELLPDGELILHHFLRRRTTRVDLVRRIELREHDEGPNEFDVALERGRFTVEADNNSRSLMGALIARNPSIERDGV